MPTLRALIVQATGMTEKLAPFALAMTTFDVVLTLLEDASGDKKKVVPATAGGPGLTNSIVKSNGIDSTTVCSCRPRCTCGTCRASCTSRSLRDSEIEDRRRACS